MNHVLYTTQMEPITIINLPDWAMGFLIVNRMLRVPVPPMFDPSEWRPSQQRPQYDDFKIVRIYAELLVYRGNESWILITEDEESALLLKTAFLPGQNGELARQKKAAFEKGFVDGLIRALGGPQG